MNKKDYKGEIHCVAPFSSAVIMQNNYLMPCCEWRGSPVIVNIDHNATIHEQFDLFDSYRQDFLTAKNQVKKVPSCMTCANASLQYKMHNDAANPNIDYIKTPTLTNLHLKFSNFCNLACRMCDPDSSSVLAKERGIKFTNKKNPYLQQVLEPGTVLYESIYDTMKDLNRLWFSGGEPLIQEEVWNIVEYCVQKNYAKNIEIKFNTNGTVVLTASQIEMLLKFKKVNLDISMDGTKTLAEYIRTKVDWEKWLDNFKQYLQIKKENPHFEIFIATALSIYNVHRIDEIHEFFSLKHGLGMSFTPVWDPKELCVANLNKNAKKYLIKKYQNHQFKDNFPEVLQLLNMNAKVVDTKNFILQSDERALKSKLYKNYKRYQDIEYEWFNML